eukprot:755743-Hanusia_phi.AAC.3
MKLSEPAEWEQHLNLFLPGKLEEVRENRDGERLQQTNRCCLRKIMTNVEFLFTRICFLPALLIMTTGLGFLHKLLYCSEYCEVHMIFALTMYRQSIGSVLVGAVFGILSAVITKRIIKNGAPHSEVRARLRVETHTLHATHASIYVEVCLDVLLEFPIATVTSSLMQVTIVLSVAYLSFIFADTIKVSSRFHDMNVTSRSRWQGNSPQCRSNSGVFEVDYMPDLSQGARITREHGSETSVFIFFGFNILPTILPHCNSNAQAREKTYAETDCPFSHRGSRNSETETERRDRCENECDTSESKEKNSRIMRKVGEAVVGSDHARETRISFKNMLMIWFAGLRYLRLPCNHCHNNR